MRGPQDPLRITRTSSGLLPDGRPAVFLKFEGHPRIAMAPDATRMLAEALLRRAREAEAKQLELPFPKDVQ